MRTRWAVRLISYLGTAAVAFGVLYALEKRDADTAQRALRYRGEQAFEELCDSVSALDAALQKTLYAVSPDVTASLCAEISARAQSADHALGSLAFPMQELERTASFLATTGDYAGSATLSENLRQLRADMADGLVSAEAALDAQKSVPLLSDSFLQMEQEFPEMPTLVYDGPFSSDKTERTPRMGIQGKEIDSDAAMLVAAGFLGVRSNQTAVDGQEEGRLPVWRIRAGDYTVSVSRRGGYVVRAISSRTPTRCVLSLPDALQSARRFLSTRPYGELIESYHVLEGNVLTVTFCAGQDGVICYPDMLKVSVAMDTGELLRFDAEEYLTCHTQRELGAPVVSAQEAAARVPASLTLLEQRLAVIPSAGTREIYCWELICQEQSGQHCLLYFNAVTGAQERILLLLEDDSGTLAL